MPLAYYSISRNSTPHKTSRLMSEYRLAKKYISSTQCHDHSMVSITLLTLIIHFSLLILILNFLIFLILFLNLG